MKKVNIKDFMYKKDMGDVENELTKYLSAKKKANQLATFANNVITHIKLDLYSTSQRKKLKLALQEKYGVKNSHIQLLREFNKIPEPDHQPTIVSEVLEEEFSLQLLEVASYNIGFKKALEIIVKI